MKLDTFGTVRDLRDSSSHFRRRLGVVCAVDGYFPITSTSAITGVPISVTLPVPTDIVAGEVLTIYGTASSVLHGTSVTVNFVTYAASTETTTIQMSTTFSGSTLGNVSGGWLVRSGATANTLTVALAGDTTAFSGVRYLNTFAPKAGGQVWLDTDGVDVMAVGALAGRGGHACVANVRLNANLSVPADGTNYTTVGWEHAANDPFGVWQSGKPNYLMAPVSGFYLVRASVAFAAGTSGQLTLGIFKNTTAWTNAGTSYAAELSTDAGAVYMTATAHLIPMDVGETITIGVRSATARTANGGALNETSASLLWVGPKA